jgi:hypothetical protein
MQEFMEQWNGKEIPELWQGIAMDACEIPAWLQGSLELHKVS